MAAGPNSKGAPMKAPKGLEGGVAPAPKAKKFGPVKVGTNYSPKGGKGK